MGNKRREPYQAGRYLCQVCGGLHFIGEDPHQLDISDELEEIERLSHFDPDREDFDRADDSDNQ